MFFIFMFNRILLIQIFVIDTQITENNDMNAPFKIHRKFIQNQCKILSPETSEKKNSGSSSPQKRLEIWRNAFRVMMTARKPQTTASTQSTLTSETLPVPQNSPKKSANEKCESVFTSTSTSSTKHNTPIKSPRKLTSPKKQTEAPAKPIDFNDTSKLESSTSNKNFPSDTNVEEIISDFTQSKNGTVSKSPCKNTKEIDVTISDAFLNSSKKILEMSPELHKKPTNSELSTNDMSVKSKTSKGYDVERSSHTKRQIFKCIVCGTLFKSYKLLLKHMANNLYKTCSIINSPTSSNASECMEVSLDETIMNKEHNQNLKNSKLSTLQKQWSVNRKDGLNQSNKSVVDSDMEILSSSSSSSSLKVAKTHHEHFKMPHKKTKSEIKLKRNVTCKICLRDCDTQEQLLQHMFKHMANDLRSMYTSIENEIASTHQESNDQASDSTVENSEEAVEEAEAEIEEVEVTKNGINEQDKRLPENANELSAENLVASKVSQQDATKERNKTSNLSAAEYTTERDVEKQSTLVASNAEQKTTKMQCAEKEKTCVAGLSSEPTKLTICECHRPKNGTDNETMKSNVYIEIVLLCTTCQTLFRRFECFEAHCTQYSAKNTLCNKNRRNSRNAKLLCVSCQQMLVSIQDLLEHLMMHSRHNRTGRVTFCCNICKVVFFGLGPLFNSHFQNHAKNPFFLASRLSFPRPSYIGSKFLNLLTTDNDKLIEVYMQVADYVCQECRMPFVSEQNLKSHKTICQSVTNTVDSRSGSSDGRNTSITSITPGKIPILLICGFCNKTFYSRMSFELHSLEHTQKREMHMHYTCVSVTAVTKVYICKVCTTMWRSLQNFDEHWQTHSELRAVYVCSRCQSYYNSIELFQKHAIVHKSTNELQQMPITCEVIYRDVTDHNSNTNLQKDAVNELPYMNLSCFDVGKDFAEKTANNKSRESQEQTYLILEKLLCGNRSTQVEAIPPESSISNKEAQATKNISQAPVQVPSSNVAVTQSKRSSNGNSGNFDDSDEEEELTIVLSESEESSISSGIKKNAVSTSTKRQNTQENTKSTTSDLTDGQMQCSNDAVPAAAKTSNDMNGSASSNARISVITPRKSVNTQLNTNASVSKDNILENYVDHSVSSEIPLTETLPKNAMSSVPKSFLRVKSLAELTNAPQSEKQLCQVCGMSFESRHKLKAHLSIHNVQSPRQDKKDNQTSSSDNAQVWPTKPTFDPSILMPTITQDRPLSSAVAIGNVIPSVSVRPNTPTQVIDTATSRKYQVIGVKPLPSVKSNTIVSKPKETLPQEMTRTLSLSNVSATPQKTAFHQNLPPHISHPLNKSIQSAQQSTGTVAVRPFLQTTYQVPRQQQQQSQQLQQPSYLQQQQSQQLQQPPQVQQSSQLQRLEKPPQVQQSSQLQQRLEQSQQQLQQTKQQQQQQLQQQQQQLRQQLQPQPQQLQQQQQPQKLHQQSQQLRQQLLQQQPQQLQQQLQQQQQTQQLQLQLQLQQQQRLQQQQQQQQQLQQQQINLGNNVMHYVISNTDASYQLTPTNMIPTSSGNVMLVAVNTMQQISKNPDRYICLYCPGFECGSVQEFALHEHSPKHEARSHYNSVAYVPRT